MESAGENRLKLTLHYDGSAFFGWQIQREERTVQGEIQSALERLTGGLSTVIGSGRTDRGVHATGQVAAVSVPERWSAEELHRALNAVLPDDLWVERVDRVNPDFHPRYDAIARTYEYRLGLVAEASSPFHRRWCWPYDHRADPALLEQAASELSGTYSFERFAKAGQPQRGYRCTIMSAAWEPWETLGRSFRITADRYLHHMVRYLVGTMVQIASNQRPLADLEELLRNERTELDTSPPAPPEGLFLVRVDYPEPANDAGPGTHHTRSTPTL
ncbi:MAG: tRNA pseudouridine(38-40) synthase TruA [Gemmatimonadota bacterium]|nr:MAG: tRNA pseudouridine(38-40) synthase TruA [Gemmatimonadota bacterium]